MKKPELAYSKALVILGVLAGFTYALPAAAETINCINITSIPTTITTQGVYCLKQNVSGSLASGAAITVNTNNVTIDCNEYKVGNLAAGPTTNAVGISANTRLNVQVRNCGVRGFRVGIQLLNGDYRVQDNRVDLNTQTGIYVTGDGSAIRRNEVVDTGGTPIAGTTQFHGINSAGDVDIIDNTVSGVVATGGSNGTTYGIRTEDMDSGTIKGNRVRNLVPNGSGSRRGIWNQNGNRNTVEGNTIVMASGLLGTDAGIRCGDGLILSGGSRDNIVLGAGLIGQLLSFVNCTTIAGDYANPL
ncbi:hypothetical protein [Luteimonas aquatica]|uniref:hypothetical protein n=1 Tax=Luteimonas aquatica TaxID=450364 RepID=UPI001F5995F0|nr:hypothetical protein [Luteimonas aquatica]